MAHGLSDQDRSAWEQRGGRVRIDSKGRPVFIIRKQVDGRRYEVSTKKHSLAAALAEWDKFERNPDRYGADGPVYLSNDLAADFLVWSLNEKGNTVPWVKAQKSALKWWGERLAGVNLRKATARAHFEPALEGVPGRRHKIEVIKAFYGWMVKRKHLIDPHEDPTFRVLAVPQAKPAQWDKSKVIPVEHYLLVRDALTSPWREVLIVLAGTGWHVTEVVRFAEGGSIEPVPKSMKNDGGAVAVLVCPRHKSGDVHRTAVSKPVLEAAVRLRERGHFSRDRLEKVIRATCRAVKCPDGTVGIPIFLPAWFRHTTATLAYEAGADLGEVSKFLGHKSTRTTSAFYAVRATAPKVPTVE
jgi:hypothetical protein